MAYKQLLLCIPQEGVEVVDGAALFVVVAAGDMTLAAVQGSGLHVIVPVDSPWNQDGEEFALPVIWMRPLSDYPSACAERKNYHPAQFCMIVAFENDGLIFVAVVVADMASVSKFEHCHSKHM